MSGTTSTGDAEAVAPVKEEKKVEETSSPAETASPASPADTKTTTTTPTPTPTTTTTTTTAKPEDTKADPLSSKNPPSSPSPATGRKPAPSPSNRRNSNAKKTKKRRNTKGKPEAPEVDEWTEEEKKEIATGEVAEGEDALQSRWTIWFDKKLTKKEATETDWQQHLNKIGTFNSAQSFWSMYTHLAKPSNLPRDSNFYVFRGEKAPSWENYSKGGCWTVKIRKRQPILGRLWEELVFAAIGEVFEEPDLVGVVLGIRHKEDLLSIWVRNSNTYARFAIGDKIRSILHLDGSSTMEYKCHTSSIRDGSTYRNGQIFKCT